MIDNGNLNSLLGARVTDADGDKIGTVAQIYVDPDTDQATWATVKAGLFRTSETFAPLDSASWNNDSLSVPFEKEFVKNAPRVEADGALSEDEEKALHAYYGNGSRTDEAAFDNAPAAPVPEASTQAEGYDTSGPITNDALDGPEISEKEHEIVLTADQVVVDKEAVPVERISLT